MDTTTIFHKMIRQNNQKVREFILELEEQAAKRHFGDQLHVQAVCKIGFHFTATNAKLCSSESFKESYSDQLHDIIWLDMRCSHDSRISSEIIYKYVVEMLSAPNPDQNSDVILSDVVCHDHSSIPKSLNTEPKARFEHDLNHIKTSLSKVIADTVSGVSICKLYRTGKKVDSGSPQKNRLLKVTFNTVEERNLILRNSRKLIGSGIYVREDLSLADRNKRRAAEAEINERRQNGKRNLVLKGFQIVKVRSKTIFKPLWVARESSPQT
ncbi:unnamed protein product [Schistosoma curassoni]|uniref:Smr domain-containing protein n=1 Tax=Schistosoma curassoni TaxID=6186 RepID=A0A183KLH4_9TREM|nr:unnamed protein product [Schistosoma curassoni]